MWGLATSEVPGHVPDVSQSRRFVIFVVLLCISYKCNAYRSQTSWCLDSIGNCVHLPIRAPLKYILAGFGCHNSRSLGSPACLQASSMTANLDKTFECQVIDSRYLYWYVLSLEPSYLPSERQSCLQQRWQTSAGRLTCDRTHVLSRWALIFLAEVAGSN